MAYWIGTIVGAVLFAYLWTRLWLWLIKKFGTPYDPTRTYIAYGAALATALFLGGLGFQSFSRAFITYIPAFAVWFVVDLLANKGRKTTLQEKGWS